MKLALIGYGKMGRLVEEVARQQGLEVVGAADPGAHPGVLSRDQPDPGEGGAGVDGADARELPAATGADGAGEPAELRRDDLYRLGRHEGHSRLHSLGDRT